MTGRAARRLLAPVAECLVDGETIKIGLSSEIEHYRADTYATKEPETIAWLRQNLKEHDIFYDIGANIGLYTIFAAKIRPTCRVYAFEPESKNFSRLCANILLNKLDNVTPCSFPLSEREAFELFHVYDVQPGSALHSLGAPSSLRRESDMALIKQGVLTTTLDSLVQKYGFPMPTLMKLDVDGIEEKILDGAAKLLSQGTLRSILIEVTFRDRDGVPWAEDKLGRLGYQVAKKSEWSVDVNGFRSQNYVFQYTKSTR